MKQLVRILATKAHIFVLVLAMTVLTLGAISQPSNLITPVTPSQKTSRSSATVPSPSTSPTTRTDSASSNAYVFHPENDSDGPVAGQNVPDQSTSVPLNQPGNLPTPVNQLPTMTCDPCNSTIGCADTACTPVEPTPEPTPAPQPPTSYCAPCGTYVGPRPQRVMCPMYCMDTAQ